MAKKVLAALGAPAAVAAGALGGVYAFVFAPGTSGREDCLPPQVRFIRSWASYPPLRCLPSFWR